MLIKAFANRLSKAGWKNSLTVIVFLLVIALTSRADWRGSLSSGRIKFAAVSDKTRADIQIGDRTVDGETLQATAAVPWSLSFHAIPGSDGDSLFVSTGRTEELGTSVFANADRGSAVSRDRHAMTYGEEERAYSWTFDGFFDPVQSLVEGSIQITTTASTTQTQDTGPVGYRRFYIPVTNAPPVVSDDNLLELTLNDHSLPVDAYIIVMSTNSPPATAPTGHSFVGTTYSVRASGAIISSTQPILLRLAYSPLSLGDLDPHVLSVFAWDPVKQKWYNLGGDLDSLFDQSLNTLTSRFTIFGLIATPRWRDIFSDFTGLSEWDGVTVLLPGGELVLNGLVYTGIATSRTITPAVPINEWGTISFTRTVPAGTNLTVDVLSTDGTPLVSDVTSGTSLASIDPTVHHSLRLQAAFSTDDLAYSASLDEWSINWQPKSHAIYLPSVLKR